MTKHSENNKPSNSTKPAVSSSTFCCGIFPTNDCTECGYYKQNQIKNKNGERIIRWISEVHLTELEHQEFKKQKQMKLQDLSKKKTVMIKPQGLINYREMKVTPTQTGFTISNYGNEKISGNEYLFVVDCQEDLDALDVLQ